MHEKQHASIEIASLSKENGFQVSAKRQHWFFGKPGRWPPKNHQLSNTFSDNPLGPHGTSGIPHSSPHLHWRNLEEILGLLFGYQWATSAEGWPRFWQKMCLKTDESQLWECFGQPSPSTKALFFSNRIPNYPSHNKNIIFHWWNNQDTKTSWKKSGYKNQWECGKLQECMQLNIPC